MQPLKIFIGYDEREPDAYDVCAHTLRKHTSIPLAISALVQPRLRKAGLFTRPEEENQHFSTQFAMTRFLVPLICDFKGMALFVDCDFMFNRDIADIIQHVSTQNAVSVVKHDYVPRATFKMDGQPQTRYPRKNWSSLMWFNNERCKILSHDVVNDSSPAALHQFKLFRDEEIGALPQEWNWLEGDYDWPHDGTLPAAVHFTNGGPWFADHRSVRFGDIWEYNLAEVAAEREARQQQEKNDE